MVDHAPTHEALRAFLGRLPMALAARTTKRLAAQRARCFTPRYLVVPRPLNTPERTTRWRITCDLPQ